MKIKLMKRLAIGLTLLLSANLIYAKVEPVTVKGTIKGMKESKVLIYDFEGRKCLGEAMTDNGSFSIEINADTDGQKCFVYFSCVDDGKRDAFWNRFFYVDNTTIELSGRMRAGAIGRFKQLNSDTYDVFTSLEDRLDNTGVVAASKKLKTAQDKMQASGNFLEQSRLQKEVRDLESEVNFAELDMYAQIFDLMEPGKVNIGFDAKLYEEYSPYRYSFIEPIIEKYREVMGDNYFSKSYYAAKLLQRYQIISMYIKGTPCEDASFMNPEGEYVNLYDFKGKYIYLHIWDFDNSQSGDQLANLQMLAEKFKKKNVVFINVCTTPADKKWKDLLTTMHMPDIVNLWYDADYEKGLGKPYNQSFKYVYKTKYVPKAIIISPEMKTEAFNGMLPNNPSVIKYLKSIL
ncbi:peroxiredoxin family protein [Carboxylicivirga sp. RSCT41]|uniref:peroxiredoxin family protein n=1 Tax=Carboxylicivirga agarovorans TaxID=3417570 RepID=UPI003D32970D